MCRCTLASSSSSTLPGPCDAGQALRLRIDFHPTITGHEYDGLRLRVIHTDRGALDTTVLSFGDHDTFTDRDARREAVGFGRDSNDRFREWHNGERPPWHGAHTEGLTYAIEQYVRLWFPPPCKPGPLSTPSPGTRHEPAASRAAGREVFAPNPLTRAQQPARPPNTAP
jgi:hypothetical protein